jgi:protein arginine N-methyltransferase 1
VYSLAAYGDMIRDRVRMDAYAAALREAIRPGATVVDIGAGTGIMACLACRFGAARVYAIEPADVIEVAAEIARANGFAERIRFIQAPSTAVTLPERVDVIVSDLRGVLPPLRRHLPSIIDACGRWLKPGGVLIPRRDVLRVAVAASRRLYDAHVTPWERNDYGLDMQAASRLETNAWRKCHAVPGELLAPPERLATLDYRTIEGANLGGEARWTIGRGGTAHGLLVWFDAELSSTAAFTNAPGAPEAIYGQAFFPWPSPVTLAVGDVLSAAVTATLVGEDYVWSWTTRVTGEAGRGPTKAAFRQSDFLGVPLSRASLARRSADHVGRLNDEGRLDRLILQLLDEGLALGRIADEVVAKFPARCATPGQALARVADLAVRYSTDGG